MRFVIVGAGAVGAVLGISLEHGKHEVLYLLRKGRKAGFRHLILVDAKTGEARRRDNPLAAEEGDRIPPFEWALVCVRGDQLDAAIETMKAHVRSDAKVGVACATEHAVSRVRAAHPGGPVFSINPTFSAWSEETNLWKWFRAPLLKSVVSGEGDAQAEEAAREFAAMLEAVGVPARVARSTEEATAWMAPLVVMLAGWELAKWDAGALARDADLRALTAKAMREAAEVSRAEATGALRHLRVPALAFDVIVRLLPSLAKGDAEAMWRHHGPKIAAQTREAIASLCARASKRGVETVSLRVLRDRLPAIKPASATALKTAPKTAPKTA